MSDSLFETLCSWNDEEWEFYTCPQVEKPKVDEWQKAHDERFKNYTDEDWKQECENQRLSRIGWSL